MSSPAELVEASAFTSPVRAKKKGERQQLQTRTVTFVFDAGPHAAFTRPQIHGSWDPDGKYCESWCKNPVEMTPLGEGRWSASIPLLDEGRGQVFEWGLYIDTPAGCERWGLMGERNLQFRLDGKTGEQSYTPITSHLMGVHRRGEDGFSFRYWAPHARKAQVKITDGEGRVERLPMTLGEGGIWLHEASAGWKTLEDKAYVYEVEGSSGQTVERADPYSRRMQGEQRGLSRFFLDLKTGKESRADVEGAVQLMRFEVDDEPKAEEVLLRFRDATGQVLNREALSQRLGAFDGSLIKTARQGRFNDHWSQHVEDDGTIRLVAVEGAFSSLVNNPDALVGLRYEFEAYGRNEAGERVLLDDKDRDGKLSGLERRASGYNDPWSQVITPLSGISFRGGVITEARFAFQHQHVPREIHRSKWVIYQAHPGSFAGAGLNVNRSTFEDLTQKLSYLKELGVNVIELNPTNEVEGIRDWGYGGASTLAAESSLGFEDETGRWVHGDEALKRFIDEAHRLGFVVLNDVVYNHVFGLDNPLWQVDGPLNPYFNWSQTPGAYEERVTPWGRLPALWHHRVRQFFVDHSATQLMEYGFDGLRFDFTEPIKGQGGQAGWETLREIMRLVHQLNPHAFMLAEQFDYDPHITEPIQGRGGGGGFDAQWYTEIQHRMTHDNNPSDPGAIQAAAQWKTPDMDRLMQTVVAPRGLYSWSKAVAMISNHDEVGNAKRTVKVADGNSDALIPPQWARNCARLAAGFGLSNPGIPMFFQGDESLAQNAFTWSLTSTWDLGWEWEQQGTEWDWSALTFNDTQKAVYERLFLLSDEALEKDAEFQQLVSADRQVFSALRALPEEQREQGMLNIIRRQTSAFYKAAIALRKKHAALQGDQRVSGLYTHNNDGVMATLHEKGDEAFVRVISLNRKALKGYRIPLPPGEWREVFNSDDKAFGGEGVGNGAATFEGDGFKSLTLPAGGSVLFQRVGREAA